ncbi:MAG: zinc metallopeptidase [Rikenellaceae bacterium]
MGYSGAQIGAFVLIIALSIVGWLVQMRLKSVFEKYSNIPSVGGLTGAQAAEKMLNDMGISDVKVVATSGALTDHYNPTTKTIALSEPVYGSRSVAAVAVACHECGHAVQHAKAYKPLVLRSVMVPSVSFSSRYAQWLVFGGLVLASSGFGMMLCWIGVGMMGMAALFSIVTLPVEYNASNRALEWMRMAGVVYGEQEKQARIALNWAARTYLVAALSAVASLLYYVMLIMGGGRRRD